MARPNLVLVLTDDQAPDTLPHDPPVMPALQARLADPSDHWVQFSEAFLNTPLCCPSRATILTGLYSHHTGVQTNSQAARFDDSSTIAIWLHDVGYRTGLFGKYLNNYPFTRGHFVPPGWDRWAAFEDRNEGTQGGYYNYTMNEDGLPVTYGGDPEDYSTDVLAAKAVSFVQTTPAGQPFFLYLAPKAPHAPSTPAPRHSTAFRGIAPTRYPDFNEADVSDKPAWVRALPLLTANGARKEDGKRRQAFATLLAVDEAISAVLSAVQARGELENTVVIVMSDNGIAFGEHRMTGKRCPYEECIGTPFVVRFPGATSRVDARLVGNVDVAPTLAELAGAIPATPVDGVSLVPILQGLPTQWRTGTLEEWAGDTGPETPYWGVRTADFAYFELATGEVELYDLTGAGGPADPYELVNRCPGAPGVCSPAYSDEAAALHAELVELRGF